MARLKDLSNYRLKLLYSLLSSENIVKAVAYPQKNFLDLPIPDHPEQLIMTHIFPNKKMPNTETEQKTYIVMRVGGFKRSGTEFKDGYITIFVLCHESLLWTNYEALRTDYIVSEIDELLNKSRDYGIGKLQFDGMDEFDVDTKGNYAGMWIRYKVLEFN